MILYEFAFFWFYISFPLLFISAHMSLPLCMEKGKSFRIASWFFETQHLATGRPCFFLLFFWILFLAWWYYGFSVFLSVWSGLDTPRLIPISIACIAHQKKLLISLLLYIMLWIEVTNFVWKHEECSLMIVHVFIFQHYTRGHIRSYRHAFIDGHIITWLREWLYS